MINSSLIVGYYRSSLLLQNINELLLLFYAVVASTRGRCVCDAVCLSDDAVSVGEYIEAVTVYNQLYSP